MSGRIEGKVAIVTGGASGIGAGTVRRFVEEGARVVVADLQVDSGKRLAAELGERARFIEADVADEHAVAAAVDLAVAEFGRLDCMFNNAGILGAVGSISRTSVEDWDRSVAVLLRSVFLGMKHAARVMVPQRSGVIISTSSTAGITGGLGPHAYTACKTAVIGLTRSVAGELAQHGVRVNAIAPGNTVTGMTAFAYTGDASEIEATTERIRAGSNLGIAGEPVDIANAALYLASDEARYVTGHCLVVDAGQTTNAGSVRFASAEPALILERGRTE
jgi:NAD(P)-dependent dehydrogenase (short-subunit alcohol dehydrogenase family)